MPTWISGLPVAWPPAGEDPIVWHLRLDDSDVAKAAAAAPLRSEDLHDLAHRPHAALRALRRQLTKVMLARIICVNPCAIRVARTPLGALAVVGPDGWHVSVAARWPNSVIGIAREPLGVDIERMLALPLPQDALDRGERRRLATASPFEWTACWVAKEAHSKRLGTASSIEPRAISTRIGRDGSTLAVTDGDASCCHFRREAGLVLGVALANRCTAASQLVEDGPHA